MHVPLYVLLSGQLESKQDSKVIHNACVTYVLLSGQFFSCLVCRSLLEKKNYR